MAEIGTELRVLQLFETFARLRRPLRLSDLASEMEMPVSSCFALVRRLLAEGHLFEPVEKRGFYPTGKLGVWTGLIAAHDPVVQRVEHLLKEVRDRSGETVTFGRQNGGTVVYIAAIESLSSIRMAGRVGLVRPIHAVSLGKALLSTLTAEERAALFKGYRFTKLTPATRGSAAELEADILEGQRLGYFVTREESVEGAMALAVPVSLAGQNYAIQAAGPVSRVEMNLSQIAKALRYGRDALDEQAQSLATSRS